MLTGELLHYCCCHSTEVSELDFFETEIFNRCNVVQDQFDIHITAKNKLIQPITQHKTQILNSSVNYYFNCFQPAPIHLLVPLKFQFPDRNMSSYERSLMVLFTWPNVGRTCKFHKRSYFRISRRHKV